MRRVPTFLFLLFPGYLFAAEIDVEVTDVEDELRDNALAFLSIHQYRDKEDLTETMIRRLHQRAPEEIRRALSAFGHYRPQVESGLEQTTEGWRARYAITPGPPVRIRDINLRISGDDDARVLFKDIIADPPLKRGDVLRHSQYESLKSALLSRAAQGGYLDATFDTQRLAVNTDALHADIDLSLDTRDRFHFGNIDIQQDILDDDFVRRFLDFSRGDPLDYNALLDLQYALTDSEYFSAVSVEAPREEADADRRIPVRVTAEANERSRYTAGLGYGTDTGARITLGFERRYVNRRGHKLATQIRLSEIEDTYTVRYTIPLEEPARESFQLFAGTIRTERADTESDRIALGVSRVRTLGDWEQTLFLRAEREDSTFPDGGFRSESLIPGASWLKTAADDLFYTRDGYKLYADLHGSHPSIGSTTGYLQLHVLAKRIFPIGERWRLLLRAEGGATALDDASLLPVSQRFFAGGDYSVRGYDYNRLAPPDENDFVVGGKYLATGSAEIEYRFAENWAVAGFTDVGNAMNDLDTELKQSVGAGLRWISPVGVVRLDIARPLNPDFPPPHGVELHISVGPDL